MNVLMGQLKMDMSRKSSLIKSVRWKIPIRLPGSESTHPTERSASITGTDEMTWLSMIRRTSRENSGSKKPS